MYLDTNTIITIAAVLGAITAIAGACYSAIKWFQKQEKQSEDIEKLREKEAADIKAVKEELCLTTYAMLACLSGLKQLNCNGPVTEAYEKLQEHINQNAHSTGADK